MPYFPQGQKEMNYLRHLVLLYGDWRRPWTEEHLRYYVAHLNSSGEPDDWLFDSFLFLNNRSSDGSHYCADINLGTTMSGEGDFFARCSPTPADKRDWEELLDFYFGPSGCLAMLESTINTCSSGIPRPYGHPRNVILMLPYPHITQHAWGVLPPGERILDFSIRTRNLMKASEDRLRAEQWVVDEVLRRYGKTHFRHIKLLGLYWMFETVFRSWDVDDHWVLKELKKYINAKGLKFFWIPFWSSYNVHLLDDYQKYYFDLAFLQPNYMFYRRKVGLEEAAHAARQRNAGLEMEYYLELDEPIAILEERHLRFREYLNGGVVYGYMKEAACAHFQGVGSLEKMHRHEDPVERELYDDIYLFVRADYRIKPALPRLVRGAG